MAKGGKGDITDNDPGQGFTSTSPCTHVQGAYGAPTGAVERHCALARAAHKTSQTLAEFAVTPVGRGIGREIVSYGVCARLSATWATVWPER